jgi:DNA-binding MarR family transcriptional regulator
MTPMQASVVATLRTHGPQTPRQVARHLGWGTERVEGMLRKLERAGTVRRRAIYTAERAAAGLRYVWIWEATA